MKGRLRKDLLGSRRNFLRTADRPNSIRKPMSPRDVRVTSIENRDSPMITGVRITGRTSLRPSDDRTGRNSKTRHRTSRAPTDDRCSGWISKTAKVPAFRSTMVSPEACSAEVLAPVSTLALIGTSMSDGNKTHSRHPMTGFTRSWEALTRTADHGEISQSNI